VTLPAVLNVHAGDYSGRYWTGPPGQLCFEFNGRRIASMVKRIFIAFLWFYTGWYGGALFANFLGLSPALGPLIGAVAAALIIGDPRQLIWKAKSIGPSITASAAAVAADSSVANPSADTEVWSKPA
jgi:hypothetical protein